MRAMLRPVLVASLLIACAKQRTPDDVAAAYVEQAEVAAASASSILFVHGILGSELHRRDDGTVIWGAWGTGSPKPTRHAEDMVAMALPPVLDGDVTLREDPEVEPGGEMLAVELKVGSIPLRARAYPGVFEGVISSIASGDTHVRKLALDEAIEGRSPVYAVGYDWRRSVTAETGWFHMDVQQAVAQREAAGLDPRVDIVAHSMGTQLVRWYLRHGTARLGPEGLVDADPDWDPSRYVRQVILVAPPNLGEPSALEKLLRGESLNALLPIYDPALTSTFPSLYEILPRPRDARIVWSDDGSAVDLYDVDLWAGFGWGPFDPAWDEHLSWVFPGAIDRDMRLGELRTHVAACLDHARRYHEMMDTPRTFEGVNVHLFVGTDHPTPGVLEVDRETGALSWRDERPGDGTVSRHSALADGMHTWDSVHFVDADHMAITGDTSFIEDALYLLLGQEGTR